ncbi:MAG: PHP domain-containing protein [Candidatus Omnitrophota bacterium]
MQEKRLADLHVHTNFSDSNFSPLEAVQQAKKLGLCAIAITDHDTVKGIAQAVKAGKAYNIEVIPGIELTCERNGCEIHMLGYFIDYKKRWFRNKLEEICSQRIERSKEILEKLKQHGVGIKIEDVLKLSHGGSTGRLHIAQAMVKKGVVRSLKDAFRKYIGDKAPCYVSKFKVTPKEAIEMITKLGGVPVIAHPHILGEDKLIPEFIEYGLRGIEAYHSDHPDHIAKFYANLAKKHNLFITGGSDCHGSGKGHILMGKVKLPYELVEKLKKAKPQ